MPEGTGGQRHPPEDEIDRQLRELTGNRMGAARYIEPTAAERARRAAQYRKQTQRDQRGQRRRARRARRGRLIAVVIAVVVLAVVGGIVWLRVSHSQAPGASGVPTGGGQGSAAAADPFVGSEAGTWADGAAGITIPAANPVGNFTAAQVEAAYESTRQLLIAANLDQQTLRGGAPTAFAHSSPSSSGVSSSRG